MWGKDGRRHDCVMGYETNKRGYYQTRWRILSDGGHVWIFVLSLPRTTTSCLIRHHSFTFNSFPEVIAVSPYGGEFAQVVVRAPDVHVSVL